MSPAFRWQDCGINNIFTNYTPYINGWEKFKRASVTIPLINYNNSLHILFEVRSKTLRTQPNEVCFPGGKIEEGETPEQALKREIEEELDTKIEVYDLIDTIEYDYPNFHLSMDCFWCETITGKLVLKEAEAAKWLSKDEVESVRWLPADLTLVEKIRRSMSA